jgi:hypothetical protein
VRFIIIILLVSAICYVLLLGVPQSPGQIQFGEFFQKMTFEVRDLVDHFRLMQDPAVKITILAGAALILFGIFKQ